MVYNADASLGVKAPKDKDGNYKKYRLKFKTPDGETVYQEVDTEYMAELFVGWTMHIPDFHVDEPTGLIYSDSEVSPREAAIVRNALEAYYQAGRLDLRTQWEREEVEDNELQEGE